MIKKSGALRWVTIFIVAVSLGWACQTLAALQIHCIDVGQGDCTLIVSPTGGTLLFDAGENGQGNSTVFPYLQSLGLTALDYIACSHYHVDHIGGIDEVVSHLGIDSLRVAALDRGWSYTTAAYASYAAAVAPKRTTILDGQVIDLGGGVTVTCVAVNGNGLLSPPFDTKYDENDLCVALLVEYGDFDFFVAGDLSGVNSSSYHNIESSLTTEVGDIDVYQVDHHGSASNSNETFISAIQPEVSIISVGDGNSYGHPTQTVINRLVNHNSYIYQTELGAGGTIPSGKGEVVNGDIVITVDGGTYTVNGDVYNLSGAGVKIVSGGGYLSAFPNPFSAATTFTFDTAGAGPMKLAVYDVKGRLVSILADQDVRHGSIVWKGTSADGGLVSPGVYFVRADMGGSTLSQKLVKR
jgi:competence protein ComEC